MSYTCPRCGRTSHHPEDEKNRYCGACHAYEGQILRFFDNPEGERYVNLVDLVCWCHEFALYLKGQGEDEKADGVAAVGLAMADQMEPE